MMSNKQTKNGKRFKLPDGEVTESHEDYIEAWEDIFVPIEEQFNLRVTSFNPQIQFSFVDKPGAPGFTMPTTLAIQIRDMIKSNEELQEELDNYHADAPHLF
jgi:hypothetical protein